MSSTLASSEYDILHTEMHRFVARTNMYGTPVSVEALGMHTSHIMTLTLAPSWTFPDTEALWSRAAHRLGFAGSFSQNDQEAHRVYQWWRWGAEEERARAQVVGAYSRIWSQIRTGGRDMPTTKAWIEELLRSPAWVGPPDVLADVIIGLMRPVFEEEQDHWGALIDEERKRAGGGPARDLADIGTNQEWLARAPDEVPDLDSERCVASGIQEVVRMLDEMRAARRTTEEPWPD